MVTGRDARLTRPWCLFRSGSRPFAISLEAVAEIIEADRLERLPLCPPTLRGLCTYRREVVPVVRLTEGAIAGPGDATARLVLLILRTEQSTWGIAIDRGGAVVAEETMEELAALSNEGSGPVLIGSIHREGVVHAAIDPAPTWRRVRDAVDRWYGSEHTRALPRRTESPSSQLGAPV
jgi:purine-binding chemotaxis protein CheW